MALQNFVILVIFAIVEAILQNFVIFANFVTSRVQSCVDYLENQYKKKGC